MSVVTVHGEEGRSPAVLGASALRLHVPADVAAGVSTGVPLRSHRAYTLVAEGTYRWSAGGIADAACSKVAWSNDWVRHRYDNALGRDLLDLRIDGRPVGWTTRWSDGTCDRQGHAYRLLHEPGWSGPLTAAIDDVSHADNEGGLTLTITPMINRR